MNFRIQRYEVHDLGSIANGTMKLQYLANNMQAQYFNDKKVSHIGDGD